MKKLLLLSTLLIFACSSDDSSNSDYSIDGIWNLISRTIDGEAQELDSCELESHLEITMGMSFSDPFCVHNSIGFGPDSLFEENLEGSLIYYRKTYGEVSDCLIFDEETHYINETENPNNYEFYHLIENQAMFLAPCNMNEYYGALYYVEINGNNLILNTRSYDFVNGGMDFVFTTEVFEKN